MSVGENWGMCLNSRLKAMREVVGVKVKQPSMSSLSSEKLFLRENKITKCFCFFFLRLKWKIPNALFNFSD